jgi:hypothetical protein
VKQTSGAKSGGNPPINQQRRQLLPFLKEVGEAGRVRNIKTDYSKHRGRYKTDEAIVDWELFGARDDLFHLAMFD